MNGSIQCEWRRVPKEESEIIRYKMDTDQKALYTLNDCCYFVPTNLHTLPQKTQNDDDDDDR